MHGETDMMIIVTNHSATAYDLVTGSGVPILDTCRVLGKITPVTQKDMVRVGDRLHAPRDSMSRDERQHG